MLPQALQILHALQVTVALHAVAHADRQFIQRAPGRA